ncbi:MAG: hypothetical protein CK424_08200 [Legionella sp.]|nr:MAG: hypothetical protein CK424_08200 [Legionella sp.]
MAKKPSLQDATLSLENTLPHQILEHLDFSETQKQVAALMKSVFHETTLNENKIRFIKEQLHDQRYQINPTIIAEQLLQCVDNTDLSTTELTVEA